MTDRARVREEVSAGGVVYRLCPDERGTVRPVFLLIRDSYRNWGFPKGHLEVGEGPEGAALREVAEETGLGELAVHGAIETIDWYFRFRGRLVHKVCHFYLMRTEAARTCPQRDEGITACRWAPYEDALALVAYDNAREVLRRAQAMLVASMTPPLAAPPVAVPAVPAATPVAPVAPPSSGAAAVVPGADAA
jgi:8-oxo-dGTP pyrophosphatase MutT (NUDIX family)